MYVCIYNVHYRDYRITNSDYVNTYFKSTAYIYRIGYRYQPISAALHRLLEYWLNLVLVRKKAIVYAKVECFSEGCQKCVKAVTAEEVNFTTCCISEYAATLKRKL